VTPSPGTEKPKPFPPSHRAFYPCGFEEKPVVRDFLDATYPAAKGAQRRISASEISPSRQRVSKILVRL
jgi:hypothetical protein